MNKSSNYNIIIRNNEYLILYNLLRRSLLILPNNVEILKKILNNPNSTYVNTEKEILNVLKNEKFIIDELDSELLEIITNYKISLEADFTIAIAPTLNCNFSCSYCYQNKNSSFLNTENADVIISFIKKLYLQKINLQWIGGEPLLNKDMIYYISKKLKEIPYNSTLYTNAYLLDSALVNDLMDLKINEVYLTIDGNEEEHNKRRNINGKLSTYSTIKKNIEKIIERYDSKIRIVIKTNLDKTNAPTYNELINDFRHLKNKIRFNYTPAYIKENMACSDKYFQPKEFSRINNTIYQLLLKKGFATYKLPDLKYKGCPAYGQSIAFDPDGNVYKCIEGIGTKNYIIGKILEKRIVFNDKVTLWNNYDISQNKKCTRCKYLPICMGGCFASQLNLRERIINSNDDCKKNMSIKVEQMVKAYFANYLKEINKNDTEKHL